jgi:hypothetical protein
MSELFANLGQWLANFANELTFLPDWLIALIAPVLDLFENLSK